MKHNKHRMLTSGAKKRKELVGKANFSSKMGYNLVPNFSDLFVGNGGS